MPAQPPQPSPTARKTSQTPAEEKGLPLIPANRALHQRQTHRINAIPQISRRTITLTLKNMPQMRITGHTTHLNPHHPQRPILKIPHPVLRQRRIKRRPTTMTIKLLRRPEQLSPTRPAPIHPLNRRIPILTRKSTLSATLPQHRILQRIQNTLPIPHNSTNTRLTNRHKNLHKNTHQ